MYRKLSVLVLLAVAFVAIPVAQQAEKLDFAAIGQIRDEGLNRSQAMDTLFWLTDRYGVSWQIVPAVLDELMGDPDPLRSKRVTDAMLKMVKLDIAQLQAAYGAKG